MVLTAHATAQTVTSDSESTTSSSTTTSTTTSTAPVVPTFTSFLSNLPTQIRDNPLLGLGIVAAVILLSLPFIAKPRKNRGRASQKPAPRVVRITRIVRPARTPARTTTTTPPPASSRPPPPSTPPNIPPNIPPPPKPPPKPVSAAPDAWEVLGVPRYASSEVIKTKYHSLLVELHPDRLPAGATDAQREVIDDKVKEINDAYNRLKEQGYV
jgi:DnaJ domain